MRKLFPGYYNPSEAEFKEMWSKGLFVFDTNVLLDLYRYSDETVASLINVIETLQNRIWIPYQVSKEYHKNLNTIISGQVKRYEESIKTLIEFKKQLEEKRSHPFLADALHVEISEFCLKFDKELDEKKRKVKSLILQNPIKEKLADLLDDKIGRPLSEKEKEEIYLEGEKRFAQNIPPGYSDKKKPIPDRYGDLLVWKEILKLNSEISNPIIFVTGDTKEDWFMSELGITIGPRPELIEEFRRVRENLIYCYSTDKFLQYAKNYLQANIDEKTLIEVGEFISHSRDVNETESISDEYFTEQSLGYIEEIDVDSIEVFDQSEDDESDSC